MLFISVWCISTFCEIVALQTIAGASMQKWYTCKASLCKKALERRAMMLSADYSTSKSIQFLIPGHNYYCKKGSMKWRKISPLCFLQGHKALVFLLHKHNIQSLLLQFTLFLWLVLFTEKCLIQKCYELKTQSNEKLPILQLKSESLSSRSWLQ